MDNKNYSNSITLVRVADGESANSYFIETNYDEILRFETSVGLLFSPSVFYFKVFDLSKNQAISSFNWELSYLSNNNEYISIASKESNNYSEFLNYLPLLQQNPEDQQKAIIIEDSEDSYDCLYFYVSDFYEHLEVSGNKNEKALLDLFSSGSPVLKFSFIEEGFTRAEKIFVVKNGISADMAKLNINANDIVASIQKASLRFSANGLELHNGDFLITDFSYEEVTNITSENFDDQELYILDNNSNYTKAISFEEGMVYYIQKEKSVFYLDKETGNLAIKGDVYADNGYFKGEVQATSGTFNGNINANGGTIGGFKIVSEEQGDKKVDYLQSINGNIKLDGANGEIIAENIILGAGAKISESIEFTDNSGNVSAKILNPQKNGNLWLSAGQTSLYTDGRLNLGTIELNSGTGKNDGYIRSRFTDLNEQTQDGHWRINENGTAQFKNIYADEVHLQNSVLEIGTIQNVGSLMLFKDAWSVVNFENTIWEEVEKIKIVLDKYNSLSADDWIFSEDNLYKVVFSENKEYYKEDEIEKDKKVLATEYIEGNKYYELMPDGTYELTQDQGFYSHIIIDSEKFSGKVITKFGKTKENLDDEECDYITSIFGESKEGPDIRKFATPNSLTISSFNITEASNPIVNYTKHLILGKLSDSDIDSLEDIKGFGLYSDNVYLNGSLTTHSTENGYAGINTSSMIPFTKSTGIIQDISPIIFWGGANEPSNISNALFQVTANGTLYTTQAIIENSVIAGADIYGSKIYAAELHGWENGQSSELAIYNSSKGIVFKTEAYTNEEGESIKETSLFSISETGFKETDNYFIDLKNSIPLFIGDFKTKPGSDNVYVKASGENLSFYNNESILSKITGQIDNINNSQPYMDFNINNTSVFELRAEKIEIKKDVYINENIEMGSHTMTYKWVDDGYDLYVY